MDSVESYLDDIHAAIRPLPVTELPLADASGTVLATDVTAAWPLPGFDNSSMDGFAVLAADVAAAGPQVPVTLPVVAEVAAGDTTQRALRPGQAIRIMTGGLLPEGADAVVPVEWTDAIPHGDAVSAIVAADGQVRIFQSAPPENAVRRSGGDAKPGDVLLPAGTKLGPAQIGVLAAAGLGTVPVRRRPRVSVMSTGNELADPGTPLVPGRIWESNSYMIAAAARQAGCDAIRLPALPDDTTAVLAAIERAAADADLLITTGGVSMGGEHDVVKAALAKLGEVQFRKVAMQPGMPQGFGLVGPARTPLLTLPGNPVSAFVSFRLFAVAAIRALQNQASEQFASIKCRLTAPVVSPAAKRSFLRAVIDRSAAEVTPLGGQGSHQIAALARANALIIVPEAITELEAGAIVEVLELP